MISHKNFRKVGGMCNSFWGWGKEDSAFREALQQKGIKISQPANNIGTNCTNTFHHIHNTEKRIRDQKDCRANKTVEYNRDFTCFGRSGVKGLQYKLESVKEVKVNGTEVTFLNVKLKCNETLTPWCNPDCI